YQIHTTSLCCPISSSLIVFPGIPDFLNFLPGPKRRLKPQKNWEDKRDKRTNEEQEVEDKTRAVQLILCRGMPDCTKACVSSNSNSFVADLADSDFFKASMRNDCLLAVQLATS
uniref:Uncharacterized protein n=1 Tax=Romanomermis culicivorax TaxID=13658 RepID=A0A915HVT5_ROMCU